MQRNRTRLTGAVVQEEVMCRVEFGYSVLFLFGFSAVYRLIFGYSVKVRLGHALSFKMTYSEAKSIEK